MSSTLEIKYKCMNPSCCVNCREGVISLDEALFNELKAACEDPEVFRSPKGMCRKGYSQQFKVIKLDHVSGDAAEDAAPSEEELASDPIGILMTEHVSILENMSRIEELMKRRDMDALWKETAALENKLIIHSGLKEEQVLFPLINESMPLGEGLIAIMKEDHREIVSLLHNFRTALEEDDIMDGIIRSMFVSLKGHIRKEDLEFFALVNKFLSGELKAKLIEGYDRVVKSHAPFVAGERKRRKKTISKEIFDEQILALQEMNVDSGCCH
ncbi:MAG: hemerythrin domain-containing protein [Deltaproteobacteria bacterium]|nr:hemerythrin domain-containing protein [Deltaproteobacteria bacterium]